MSKLDTKLLKLVKQGFVPQPGGQAEPVAGASQMTAGMRAHVDPSMANAWTHRSTVCRWTRQ